MYCVLSDLYGSERVRAEHRGGMAQYLSFSALFTRYETSAAYAALEESRLFTGALPFFRFAPRGRCATSAASAEKIEISARLCRMQSAEAQQCVPPPLLRIYSGLESAAMDFAHAALRDRAIHSEARAEFLDGIAQRSVFRIWRYGRGAGCPPHCDPGLCTALLRASAPGLELSRRSGPAPMAESGTMTESKAEEVGAEAEGLGLEDWEAPQWGSGAEDTVILSGGMMRVVSGGMLPAVLHRVRPDWAELRLPDDNYGDGHRENGMEVRYSFVVELRPANPRRWYALVHKSDKLGCGEGKK